MSQLFDRPSPDAGIGERHSNSLQRYLFEASHSKCSRCSGGQVYAASLYEWAAIIDPDGDASAA